MSIRRQFQDVCADLNGAWRLTADAHSFLRLSVDFILARAMRFMTVPLAGRGRRIRLHGGTKLHYRLDRADLYTIHEVWIEEMYKLPSEVKTGVIIDLGANIGLTSLWLAKRYGSSHVIAVEPSPANADLVRRNLTQNNIPSTILEAAAGAENGTAVFDQGPGSTNGRIVDTSGGRDTPLPTQRVVDVVSMNMIFSHLPHPTDVDLLKVDIEGGEQQLLSGNLDWLQKVDAVIAEFHPALVDYPQLIDRVQSSGLRRLKSSTVHENFLDIFVRPEKSEAWSRND